MAGIVFGMDRGSRPFIWYPMIHIWPYLLWPGARSIRKHLGEYQFSLQKWKILPFRTLFSHFIAIKTYPELLQTCFQECKLYLVSVWQVRWPQRASNMPYKIINFEFRFWLVQFCSITFWFSLLSSINFWANFVLFWTCVLVALVFACGYGILKNVWRWFLKILHPKASICTNIY